MSAVIELDREIVDELLAARDEVNQAEEDCRRHRAALLSALGANEIPAIVFREPPQSDNGNEAAPSEC